MNEKHYLIKYHNNYSDEFDVDSIQVMTEQEWETLKENLKKAFEKFSRSVEVYFGTNEAIEIYSYEELIENCEVIPITKGFYKGFIKFVGSSDFGLVDLRSIPESIT